MVVQRLSIRAAKGKLQVISVWRCLAKSGAQIYRWHVDVDRKTGVESMTVDIVESDPVRTVEIASTLGEATLEMTVTLFHLAVVSNPEAPHESANSLSAVRSGPRLTVVRDITRPISRTQRD